MCPQIQVGIDSPKIGLTSVRTAGGAAADSRGTMRLLTSSLVIAGTIAFAGGLVALPWTVLGPAPAWAQGSTHVKTMPAPPPPPPAPEPRSETKGLAPPPAPVGP